jgi:glycosyltransferase involved in cell wall biosynthesis
MRIAFVSPHYFADASHVGGGERYVYNLARAVAGAKTDWRVDLISYAALEEETQLAPGVRLKLIPAANHPKNMLDTLSWHLPDAIAVADVVHLHQAFTLSSEVGLLAAKLQRKPVCLSDHGGHSSRLGESLGAFDLADRVICYSEFGATLFHTSTQVSLVKGGVDDLFFRPGASQVERDHFLYVGRLLPHKGVDRLLAALPTNLPLTVFGRPYDLSYYRLLKKLARQKDVTFITDGGDHDLLSLYRTAWAVVLPSVYIDFYGNTYLAPELMGLTLLEGMACGTPAICSNVGGLPEFVRHRETGIIFESLVDLRYWLQRLATDAGYVAQLGKHAREVIEAEFGLRVVGQRMSEIYESIANRS